MYKESGESNPKSAESITGNVKTPTLYIIEESPKPLIVKNYLC